MLLYRQYPMKIAMGIINPVVGDVTGNLAQIIDNIERASNAGAGLIIFPEMSLVGYPLRDLIYSEGLYQNQQKALITLKRFSKKITIILGGFTKNRGMGKRFFNTAFSVQNGRITAYAKHLLPQYDVFDEERYFTPGSDACVIRCGGAKVGISICEDIWASDPLLNRFYKNPPLAEYDYKNLDVLVNISASPFEVGKVSRRIKLLRTSARKLRCTVVYINQLGGNDDLIFDGGAYIMNKRGHCIFQAPRFEKNLFIHDLEKNDSVKTIDSAQPFAEMAEALALGLKDYVTKTGNSRVVLGLSGGIDSALVACLACLALGKENVLGVLLPSRYSSSESLTDANLLAKNLGIEERVVPIEKYHASLLDGCAEILAGTPLMDLTEQNLQARIRGLILMAIANNENRLLLCTTNKSEMAMGYGTLYGDMCGALAVIADLTKRDVYGLARYLNRNTPAIPENIFSKEPSAELKPGQKDTDSLPPYPELDPLVEKFITRNDLPDIKKIAPLPKQILGTILRNEYKRRQGPLGLKISAKAFGPGRRFPVVMKGYP